MIVSDLKVDIRRLATLGGSVDSFPYVALFFSASFQCVVLYRVSRWLFVRQRYLLARFVWQINFMLTGADMNPISELGKGLVVCHPIGVVVMGRAGENLTIEGNGGIGGGLSSRRNIGAGPGSAYLGDNVMIGFGSGVLGPHKIGDNVTFSPNVTVIQNVPDECDVVPLNCELRFRKRKADV